MSDEPTSEQVTEVVRLVRRLSNDPRTQLTMLTIALVALCDSCGVTKEKAMSIIGDMFDEPVGLIRSTGALLS